MASLAFNKGISAALTGLIDFDTDTFKAMLVTSAYAPNKDTHQFRSDVTNEVVGTGYTAGGAATSVTVTEDAANDRTDISFANVSWAASTITARAAVIYAVKGSAATDRLVAYVDFGADISSSGTAFVATFSSPLRFQN